MATGGTVGAGGFGARGGSLGRGGTPSSGGVPTGANTALGGTTGTAGTCGDGVVDPGEQCDLGADHKASSALWVTQSGLGFAAVPLIRTGSGADFYSYSSASAHTGFEAAGTSRIMLYLDRSTRMLSLIFFHGVDQDSTGQEQPTSHVQMLFRGLPDTIAVEVSDDSDELLMTSSTTATGFWKFTNNSDGGVLSGLPFPGDWKITVEPSFIDGISSWTWMEGNGSLVNLDLTLSLTIEARSSHAECRPDCTVPYCGDGILDGGELCDDGQPSGTGCSLNCMSFN
jgi:cysteine-rich repeat protein